jgi:hypothetical protein
MTRAEIKERVAKIKRALASPALPDAAREKLEDQLDELEILLEEEEIITVQEKTNDKLKAEAEKKIEKLEKVVASPKTAPKVKQQVKKSIVTAKKQVKEAVKEDEKERKAKYKERAKKKVAEVKSGAKRGRPKKASKPVKKAVKKRVSKAEVKYTKALRSLNALVNKTAELKAKYKGKGVDLEKDASRKAKPFGYRLKGNNYRRPTKAEIKSGEAYWEGRPNRADVTRSKYPKLEDGGMMAKGGATDDKIAKVVRAIRKTRIHPDDVSPNFVNEIANKIGVNLSSKEVMDISDNYGEKYADGGMMRKGGRTKAALIADQRLKAKKPGRREAESGQVYYESRPNRSDVNRRLRLEDGGMMKKGGRTKMEIMMDKRFKAKKPGRRTSASGTTYTETRANRSDVSRRDKI